MRYIKIPVMTLEAPEKTQTEETVEYYHNKAVNPQYAKGSENWAFMENTGKILADIPDTWKAYPNTIKGKCDIVSMEYKELQDAVSKEEKMHELEHLGAAVLNLWSALNEQ